MLVDDDGASFDFLQTRLRYQCTLPYYNLLVVLALVAYSNCVVVSIVGVIPPSVVRCEVKRVRGDADLSPMSTSRKRCPHVDVAAHERLLSNVYSSSKVLCYLSSHEAYFIKIHKYFSDYVAVICQAWLLTCQVHSSAASN